jgi:hypothetical protein
MPTVTLIATILCGLALATISGYRLFLPLLAVCLASRSALLTLQPDFLWLQCDTALAVLAAGTGIEILLSYLPRLNGFRAVVTLPIGLAAAAILAVCLLPVQFPWLRWCVMIAGGACSAVVHVSCNMPGHHALKAPWGRKMATAQNGLVAAFAICSIFIPVLTGLIALLFVLLRSRKLYKRLGFPPAR